MNEVGIGSDRNIPKISRRRTRFGERLTQARKKARTPKGRTIRQLDVAAEIGVSQQTVHKWENGRLIPTPEHMDRLAKYLNVKDDALWMETGRLPPDMMEFLASTEEGYNVYLNIRKVMAKYPNPTPRPFEEIPRINRGSNNESGRPHTHTDS